MGMPQEPARGAAETSAGQQSGESGGAGALDTIAAQAALTVASGLARAGRHGEAEAAVKEMLPHYETTPSALDLLARIRAQQGRLLEAEALWTQASGLDPDNEAYRTALRRIAKIQRRPVWLGIVGPTLAALAIVLGIWLVGVSLAHRLDRLQTTTQSEIALVRGEQQGLAAQIRDLDRKHASVSRAVAEIEPALERHRAELSSGIADQRKAIASMRSELRRTRDEVRRLRGELEGSGL